MIINPWFTWDTLHLKYDKNYEFSISVDVSNYSNFYISFEIVFWRWYFSFGIGWKKNGKQ